MGLYDLERKIRPVGQAYQKLIQDWQNLLPAQSVCLTVPLVLPDEYDDASARRRREWLADYHASRRSSTEASVADAG